MPRQGIEILGFVFGCELKILNHERARRYTKEKNLVSLPGLCDFWFSPACYQSLLVSPDSVLSFVRLRFLYASTVMPIDMNMGGTIRTRIPVRKP